MWVPLVDFEGLGGFFGFGRRGEGLAIGEEATADGWAVLGGFAVTVEEVELVGFRWCLRRHFPRKKKGKKKKMPMPMQFLCNFLLVPIGVGIGRLRMLINLLTGLVIDHTECFNFCKMEKQISTKKKEEDVCMYVEMFIVRCKWEGRRGVDTTFHGIALLSTPVQLVQ